MKEEFVNVIINSASELVKLDRPIVMQPGTSIGLVQYVLNAKLSQIIPAEDWIVVHCRIQIANYKHVLLQPDTSRVVSAIEQQFKNAQVGATIKFEDGKIHLSVPPETVIFSSNALAKYLGVPATWRGELQGTPLPYTRKPFSQYLYFYGEQKIRKRRIRLKTRNFYSSEQLKSTIDASIKKSFGDKVQQRHHIIKTLYSPSLRKKLKNLTRIESIEIHMDILENDLLSRKPLLRILQPERKVRFFKNIEYKKPTALGEVDHLRFSVLGDQSNRKISISGQIILTLHIKHA